MAKEVYIYESIYSYSAERFIKEMQAGKDDDIVVRINSNGGNPESGYGMIAKFREHEGSKLVKVDGKALSMALYFCLFADDVEALNVSEFLLHRAAYPQWIEDEGRMTQDMRRSLVAMNNNLRTALESKVDESVFKEITGYTFDDVFSIDGQLDVYFHAEDALKMGLINRVVDVTPERSAEISRQTAAMAASGDYMRKPKAEKPKEEFPKINHLKPKTMTIETLKAEHPEVYNSIFAAGVSAEKDRVMSFMAWQEADRERVSKAIAEGETMTAALQNEFAVKMAKASTLNSLKSEGKDAKNIETEEKQTKELSAEEKAAQDFLKEADEILNLKTA